MQVSILRAPPISGTIEEVQFDARGDCLWVQFESQGSPWCGVFGRGSAGRDGIELLGDGRVVILARGRVYLIDLPSRAALMKSRVDFIQDVRSVPSSPYFVTADFTELNVYSGVDLVWRSPRISLDGVALTGADPKQVRGTVRDEHGRPHPFTLDVGSWQYRCDWKCRFR